MSDEVVLLEQPRVVESDDAGSYYCAHVLLALTERLGPKRAGFLHVPRDAVSTGAAHPGADARHRDLRAVLGCAFAGIADESAARVLVTGFAPFLDVADNPTGDFVADDANLEACLAAVFEPPPTVRDRRDRPPMQGAFLGAGPLAVFSAALPVDDTALGDDGVLANAIALAKPDFVIAMGVHTRDDAFLVETVATDAGLAGGDGPPAHDPARPAARTRVETRWLAETIVRGARLLAARDAPALS